jgi:FkbM family methyltransferase
MTVDTIDVKLSDGVTIAAPATLQSITTYVLLEQETWFEKEMMFLRHWLRPGMTIIDIGANLGAYSLPMAKLVGETGHVFAYEPGSEARSCLQRSRQINGAGNLDILPSALSDQKREGRLVFGGSSELNALGEGGAGEAVSITNLDEEEAARGWAPPDFVKIDAEGEEERILAGGRDFFARHSPLVMFEVKAGDKINERLRVLFPSIGYRLFRQLAGAPILVPDFPQQSLDAYELNLFAAKPERMRTLADQGMLVDAFPTWKPAPEDLEYGNSFFREQTFARSITSAVPADASYRMAIAAYAAWRRCDKPAPVRCAALALALRGLRNACRHRDTPERLSMLARVAWESGMRSESVGVLRRIIETLASRPATISEPFWPAAARFDHIEPGGKVADWVAGAAAEQFEKSSRFSSAFSGASPHLAWLCDQPFSSSEMHRRRVLAGIRAGSRLRVPERLCAAAPDHLNAGLWRAGKVPGTVVS